VPYLSIVLILEKVHGQRKGKAGIMSRSQLERDENLGFEGGKSYSVTRPELDHLVVLVHLELA